MGPSRSLRSVPALLMMPALLMIVAAFGACGSGGEASPAPASDPGRIETSPTPSDPLGTELEPAVEGSDVRVTGGPDSEVGRAEVDNADGSPFGEQSADGDSVQFVTTPSTTTTTTSTTTLPPTTTSTTSTSTTTSSTTTSTSTTLPPPTTIRCSFGADALFEPGEAVLNDAAIAEIALLVTGVDGVRTVRVEGHTDYRGSEAQNLALSQKRADVTATALADSGVDRDSITAVGLGETEADQDNPSVADMATDRRVDVVIDAEVPITTLC